MLPHDTNMRSTNVGLVGSLGNDYGYGVGQVYSQENDPIQKMWERFHNDYLPDRPDFHRDSKVLMNHTPR